MNVSMDHMTVPLTLSAVTLRAHSPVLVIKTGFSGDGKICQSKCRRSLFLREGV